MMKKITLLVFTLAFYLASYSIDTLNVNIINDTTLTADTIYVGQGIIVESGKTLTINPGVTMMFKGDTSFNYNQGTTAGYLYVKGKLIAEGDTSKRIIFTKADTSKWAGIFFERDADESLLKFCDINNANGIDSLENFNYNGAISIFNKKTNVFACNIRNNTNSGIQIDSSDVVLYNNIIAFNQVGVFCNSSYLAIGNNTIARNDTGIIVVSSTASMVNSIVYSNNTQINGIINITYSDIEGSAPGEGNITVDPLFVDTINFKLSPCSSIINQGNSDQSNILDVFDFFGNDRVFWNDVDFGAYEHQYTYNYVSLDTIKYDICEGDSILIDGTYYKDNIVFSDNLPGVNYCDSTFLNQVIVHHMPIITFENGDTSICQGVTLQVYANLDQEYENPVYEWASSDTTETLILLGDNGVLGFMTSQKDFYLTVTVTGCVAYDTTKIVLHPDIQLELGNDTTVCRKYLLKADAGYTQYNWSNFATTSSIEVLETAPYSVTVTDQYGCKKTDYVNMTILPSPVVEFTSDSMKFTTDDTRILGGAANGYPNYLWSNGANTQTITLIGEDLGIGVYDYWLYCEFTNGCKASDTITIVITDGVDVSKIEGLKAINIYPNPSNGIINLNAEFDKTDNFLLNITDLSGRVIYSKEIKNSNFINEQIDLTEHDKGMYLMNIIHNNTIITYKLTIK